MDPPRWRSPSQARLSCISGATIRRLARRVKIRPQAKDPNGAGFVNGGDSKSFSFTPDRALVGRFACLLTGDQAAGMWSTFQVMDSGQPSLGTKA
jgi:hypothetical protein